VAPSFPIIRSQWGRAPLNQAGVTMKSASKRITITARLCETKPPRRIKVYDDKCPGLYVSITPAGVATFAFRYWDRALGKRVAVRLGDYDSVHLTIEAVRSQAFDLKGRVGRGEDVAQSARKAKAERAKLSGKTVAEVIDEYVAWMKEPVMKEDGEMRPRIENWDSVDGYLRRFVRPTLGRRIASEVDNDDIAKLQADVQAGKVNSKYKPSLSNARHTRTSASGMFAWAAQAGRRYVKVNPCHDLPALDKEANRKRVLSPEEIKTLWWGLDRPDLPYPRSMALALKFELVTMLRTKEFLTGTPSELKGLNTPDAQIQVPLKRVKKRRPIIQPLSCLAQEILAEAIKSEDQAYIFGGVRDKPMNRQTLSHALLGYTDKKGKLIRTSLCTFLGIRPFTPHDLRRTAASLAYALGFKEIDVGLCLDHANKKDEDAPARVTGIYVLDGVFQRSPKFEKKREILEALANTLRKIIGTNPAEATVKTAA